MAKTKDVEVNEEVSVERKQGVWVSHKYTKSEIMNISPAVSMSVTPIKDGVFEVNLVGEKDTISVPDMDAAKVEAVKMMREKLTRALNVLP